MLIAVSDHGFFTGSRGHLTPFSVTWRYDGLLGAVALICTGLRASCANAPETEGKGSPELHRGS